MSSQILNIITANGVTDLFTLVVTNFSNSDFTTSTFINLKNMYSNSVVRHLVVVVVVVSSCDRVTV